MCASPLSPRHAQPDWMGGGLVSRQMMHAPPSAVISVPGESLIGQAACFVVLTKRDVLWAFALKPEPRRLEHGVSDMEPQWPRNGLAAGV
jgi:hypothetical protein